MKRLARTPQAVMTPARREWLRRFDHGALVHGRNSSAWQDCHDLGWTEAMLRRADEMAPESALVAAHGSKEAVRLAGWRFSGFDRITAAGRKALITPDEVFEARQKAIYQDRYGERRDRAGERRYG